MYQNNHLQNKPIIKFLFVLCFSFLICPAFSSEDISRKLSTPNTETGYLTVSKQEPAQAKRENALHSVWEIFNSSSSGTAFAISPNQMITNFQVLSRMLKNKGSLKDIFLTQSVSSSQLQIQRVLKVSALYDLVLFETKETVSNYLKLTDDFFDPEEELSVVGYPKGGLNTIWKTGNVFQTGSLSYFPVNIIDVGGLSGSPVLNTQAEVVGTAHSSIFNLLSFTKVSDIQKLLSGKESTLCFPFLFAITCFKEEIKNIRQMAEQGSIFAQYRLANMYRQSFGTKVNLELAFYWFKKAAEQGFAPAQNNLANMYRQGFGTKVNLELAFYWVKKSAEQGFAPAQDDLANMYLADVGIEVNLELAFYWFKKAAEQGFAPAQNNLANMYRQGFGTKVNLELAFYWVKKSAELGFAPAQNGLAYMYATGVGREVNLKLAFYWVKKSAELGFAPAQHILANMYVFNCRQR